MNRPVITVGSGTTANLLRRTAGWLILLFICIGNGNDALAATRFIKYLHIEANEGDSSGGHTAIRFDGLTFHFQHEGSGLIHINRLNSDSFDHIYAMLGNRTIRESWIAVSSETYTILLDGFIRLYFIQNAQLERLAALQREAALLELLRKRLHSPDSKATADALPLKGLGFFLIDRPESPANSSNSPTLLKLQKHISSSYGERFIAERIRLVRVSLSEMVLKAGATPLAELSRDSHPGVATNASTAYEDALLALSALELLQAAPPLRPGTTWSSADEPFRLTPAEIAFLRLFAEQLENDLFHLINSPRSDWGFPFIAGLARLAALEASISSGKLVLLDLFPEERLSDPQALTASSYLPAMQQERLELFLQNRREFFAGKDLHEADYAALELAGNLALDLEQALAENHPPQQLPETVVPSRKGWRQDLPLPAMDETALQVELTKARANVNEYAAALADLYAYDLVHRNCVTEIFVAINSTLERQPATRKPAGEATAAVARKASQQRLGGYVDASVGLAFVPFISADEVNSCYAVTNRHERLSFRAGQLAEMKKHESALLVFLRESNTITSTIYQPAANDSPFLFYTDDTHLFRPLFGAANFLVGLGNSILGLVTMPVAGPKRLQLGAKGMLFSLPELAFFNLRKGSLEYVPRNR
jgi:hypothetical protein